MAQHLVSKAVHADRSHVTGTFALGLCPYYEYLDRTEELRGFGAGMETAGVLAQDKAKSMDSNKIMDDMPEGLLSNEKLPLDLPEDIGSTPLQIEASRPSQVHHSPEAPLWDMLRNSGTRLSHTFKVADHFCKIAGDTGPDAANAKPRRSTQAPSG